MSDLIIISLFVSAFNSEFKCLGLTLTFLFIDVKLRNLHEVFIKINLVVLWRKHLIRRISDYLLEFASFAFKSDLSNGSSKCIEAINCERKVFNKDTVQHFGKVYALKEF